MSKEAALRAMREARYAERTSGAATPRRATPATRATAPATKATGAAEERSGEADELCGHRSMNGRTCTREAGHSAKSHRYSTS
jgi:hypothetical protein